MSTVIDRFDGEYRFLSNFYPCEVYLDGVAYPSVENAYQAAKTLDLNLREPFTRINASAAKKLGKSLPMREDWSFVKAQVMIPLLVQKFRNPILKKLLVDTGNAQLIEGNWWGDTYWGVCRGNGKNMLGKIIMQIRRTIQCQL